jgi:ethylmalonyl-CoA/methylmalonyl-CoA decarboxylase
VSDLPPAPPPDSSLLRRLPRGGGRVWVEQDGPVARLWIDHPARRNALSPGMMLDLGAAVEELRGFGGAAVVVCGAGGRGFCAGGDLEAVQAHLLDAEGAGAMQAWMRGALDALADLPLRVIGAVEGAALGGGAELLTACDEVFAAADARIGFVHASLGVSPGWGGAARLVGRRGPRVAGRALLAARPFTGEEDRKSVV